MTATPRPPDERRPALANTYRLQFEPAQDCWVLLYPEGLVKLNAPASEILRRCDGKASVDEITADLEKTFGASGLHGDVEDFLRHAYKQNWVI